MESSASMVGRGVCVLICQINNTQFASTFFTAMVMLYAISELTQRPKPVL